MITREEYLKALDIIEAYHEQLNLSIVRHRLKTPIVEWDKFDDCSQRLRGILYHIRQGSYHYYKESNIEDIDINKMRKFPQCGRKTLNEFIKLRGY